MQEILGEIWALITDNPAVGSAVVTVAGYLIVAICGKLGRIGVAISEVWADIKDGTLSDEGMARLGWRIVAIATGPWPNKGAAFIRKYAPEHQRKAILGE